MQTTPEISFANVDPSPELRGALERHIEDLERFYDRIVSCRVRIEKPHRRRQTGDPVYVRIEVSVPGRRLVVSRDRDGESSTDPDRALKEAFDEMTRVLEDYAREQRGDVKSHEAPSRGNISELASEHGFIDASDGQIVYFHPNSVVGADFESLSVGDEVRFSEGQGLEGPQATSVRRIRKHYIEAEGGKDNT